MTALEVPPWARTADDRARRGGSAILDQPDVPPAVWGHGKTIAWPSGQGTMVTSQQGLGKSTLAQQLVMHRIGVRRGDLLGMPVTPLEIERRVLYLAMDRPVQITQSMRRMVDETDRETLNDRLVIWTGPLPFRLLDDPLKLSSWVHEVCPGVGDVVVDSVKDLAPGISQDEVGAAINIAWQGVIAEDVELLLLHHQRKAAQGTSRINSLDDVYGSTWLTAGLGSVFALEGEPGDAVVGIKHIKQPLVPVDDSQIFHDHATGTTTLRDVSTISLHDHLARVGEAGTTAEYAALETIGSAESKELQKVRRLLNGMVKRGDAEKMPGGRTKAGAEPDRWRLCQERAWAVELDAEITS